MSTEIELLKEQVRRLEDEAQAQAEAVVSIYAMSQAQADFYVKVSASLAAIESRLGDVEYLLGESDDIVLSDEVIASDPGTVNGRIAMVRKHVKYEIQTAVDNLRDSLKQEFKSDLEYELGALARSMERG